MAALPENQQNLYRNIPLWVNIAFAFEALGGLLGTIGLVLRRKWAYPFFWISIGGVLCQTAYVYFLSDAIKEMGPPAIIMPFVAILIGTCSILLTKVATAKRWIR
ncbi:hypothetical protein MLD52_08695 [Puniceicoccaceae bacterium K14]|nr:hypothetical protein [Puniceicoccaceae bacterium K14]